jgi:hypothetical protein
VPAPDDHREFTRIARTLEADVVAGDETFHGSTRDLSIKGALVVCGAALPPGTPCACTLHLAGRENDVCIQVHGVVVRAVDDALAIEFRELVGPESYQLLHDLVLYNAPDPQRVEREFAAHIGLKRIEPPPRS